MQKKLFYCDRVPLISTGQQYAMNATLKMSEQIPMFKIVYRSIYKATELGSSYTFRLQALIPKRTYQEMKLSGRMDVMQTYQGTIFLATIPWTMKMIDTSSIILFTRQAHLSDNAKVIMCCWAIELSTKIITMRKKYDIERAWSPNTQTQVIATIGGKKTKLNDSVRIPCR